MFTEAVPGFSPSDEALVVASAAFQVLIDAVLKAMYELALDAVIAGFEP